MMATNDPSSLDEFLLEATDWAAPWDGRSSADDPLAGLQASDTTQLDDLLSSWPADQDPNTYMDGAGGLGPSFFYWLVAAPMGWTTTLAEPTSGIST